MKTFRLLRSLPGSAAYNMALDAEIFSRYLEDRIPVLRLYSWEKPSLTYGISQQPENEIDIARCAADGVQIAQRITGGGVLSHQDEITYSLACGKADIGEDEKVFVDYRAICAFLIYFYESLDLKPSFALEAKDFKDKCVSHALCSASREKYDIVINGKKIGGNAQKRKRDAIFQHGSIPLSIDWDFLRRYVRNLPKDISLEATALTQELIPMLSRQILEEKLIDAFAHTFKVKFIEEMPAPKVNVTFSHCGEGEARRSNLLKPPWLNKKISLRQCAEVKTLLKDLNLNTVCEEALCPNMGECFNKKQATFIILGSICTRACGFCAVTKGVPLPVDMDEPSRIAQAVKKLGLTHLVLTSVTRDDLIDGGASAFAETVFFLRSENKKIIIETLIPDFNADKQALAVLANAKPDIISHNMETVSRLYKDIRPTGASYSRSLEVLRILKNIAPAIPLKSGFMFGLGEKEEEVLNAFDDLIKAGCSYLSIGQYLAPSIKHIPVKEYLAPEIFKKYEAEAYKRGFTYVKSGPYVRSSYAAADYSAVLK